MTDDERYHAPCMRIREYRVRHGPDGEDGASYWVDSSGEVWLGEYARQAWAALPEPRNPFAFPPTTEEQLRATEESLGFPPPPLLRMLYVEVANGGFGPGYGITDARGGFTYNDDGRDDTVDRRTSTDPQRTYVALATLDTAGDDEPFNIDLPHGQWPAHCLHLAYDGCSCDFWLDADRGRIYYGEPGIIALPDEFLQRISEDPKATSLWPTFYLVRVAPSLEAWLEAWLRGERGVYPLVEHSDPVF